jgi:succinate dehydrogenase/fumarate reductase flavoprotein subunit
MVDLKCPVLVVGGGMGALAAAIEAAKYVDGVVLCSKGVAGRSGSSPFAGGYAFPAEDGSQTQAHLENTVRCSLGLGDRRLAEVLAGEAVSSVRFLEELGVRLTVEGGQYARRRGMGHDFNYLVLGDFSAGDHCGLLRREALTRRVRFIENAQVTKVLVDGGEVVGALARTADGESLRFDSRAVILAAGGATALYPFSSASSTTTGDGLILAYEAGAELVDLEFAEFTLVPMVQGRPLAVGGAGAMARNTHYLNELGQRVLEKYDPVRLERTNRNDIVRAVYEENKAGRRVLCVGDQDSLAEGARPGNPAVWGKWAAAGLNPFSEPFEWGVAIHRMLGGARIDEHGETGVPGLFCVGENAGGVHGAGRLPGHALLETVAFGRRSARVAAKRAAPTDGPSGGAFGSIRPSAGTFREQGNQFGQPLVQRIQEVMYEGAGVVRSAESLARAIRELEPLRQEAAREAGAGGGRDALNLALSGLIVCECGLRRQESRGTHVRTDYPSASPEPPQHLAAVWGDEEGRPLVRSVSVR